MLLRIPSENAEMRKVVILVPLRRYVNHWDAHSYKGLMANKKGS